MCSRELRELTHQITEGLELRGGTCGHVLNFIQMHECIEEAGATFARIGEQDALGTIAEPALGHVQNSTQVHVIIRVDQRLQVGQRVLDFTAFVELGAADELVRPPCVD